MTTQLFLVVLFAIAATVYIFVQAWREGKQEYRKQADTHWPPDLARLVMSERKLAMVRPLPLKGKPDEVYVNRGGALVPVETKTRVHAQVYLSDRIQLSVYAVLLRYARDAALPGGPARAVAGYGYVRLVTPTGVKWKRTELLTQAQVGGLVRRRQLLERGEVAPRDVRHPGICRGCAYRTRCPRRRA